MRSTKRKMIALVAALAAGTLLQYTPSGCGQYLLYSAATSLDFCAILNCSGTTFFNFCTTDNLIQPVLLDCP